MTVRPRDVAWSLAGLWLVSSVAYWLAQLCAQLNVAAQHNQVMCWSQLWAEFWAGYFASLQTAAVTALLVVGLGWPLLRRVDEDRARAERKLDELAARAALASADHARLERRVDELGAKVAGQKGCRFPVWR